MVSPRSDYILVAFAMMFHIRSYFHTFPGVRKDSTHSLFSLDAHHLISN